MATKESNYAGAEYEYGFMAARVGLGEGAITKQQFFHRLEADYPSWEVWNTEFVVKGDANYYLCYHVRKLK